MIIPPTPKEIGEAFHKTNQPHESSSDRLIIKIVIVVALLILLYSVMDCLTMRANRPLPPEITPLQKQHAADLEKTWRLKTHTWIVEPPMSRTVQLYDPAIRAWRKL